MKSSKPLKEFGAGSMGVENGYDLELLTGWIEDLVNEEESKKLSKAGQKRLSKVQDALQLLQEALGY